MSCVAYNPPTSLAQYATRYLAALGASPTSQNVQLLLRSMPLSKCRVDAVWRKDGSLYDAVVVGVHGAAKVSILCIGNGPSVDDVI